MRNRARWYQSGMSFLDQLVGVIIPLIILFIILVTHFKAAPDVSGWLEAVFLAVKYLVLGGLALVAVTILAVWLMSRTGRSTDNKDEGPSATGTENVEGDDPLLIDEVERVLRDADEIDLQRLIRDISPDALANALYGVNEAAKERIIKQLGSRGGEILRQEIDEASTAKRERREGARERLINYLASTGEDEQKLT